MSKLCSNCGFAAQNEANNCPNCGAVLQQHVNASNVQPPYPQQNFTPTNQQTVQQSPINVTFIIQQLYKKVNGVAIFWLVFGIVEIVVGFYYILNGATENSHYSSRYYNPIATFLIVFGVFILANGIFNLVCGIIHLIRANKLLTNPSESYLNFSNNILVIINIVCNVLFGLIGVVGGIIMLTAISLAKQSAVYLQPGSNGNLMNHSNKNQFM